MTTVLVERQCGCFKNSDFEAQMQFETVDEALQKAQEMCTIMNEDFCHKHRFRTEYVDGQVIIKMEMNG